MKKPVILLIFVFEILAEKQKEFSLKFFQDDYHLVPEWFQVISYDKKYVKEFVGTTFKQTRTSTAMNLTFTFNVDLGNYLDVILQLYKFASNEYREFPLRMQVNFCQGLKDNFSGMKEMCACGNFTGCPFLKGRKYQFCNWKPDDSKLPPFIPSGRYMAELQGMFHSTEIFLCRGYFAITRPVLAKH